MYFITITDYYDTVQTNYTCNAFSLGYSFEVTGKYLFGSLGLKTDVNFVNISQIHNYEESIYNQQTKDYAYFFETSDTSKRLSFYTFSLQASIGGRYDFKHIGFRLRIAGSYNPSMQYGFYGIVLDVMYNPKKKD